MTEDKILWWHTFDFPELKTEGRDDTPNKAKFIQFPERLDGLSVLDIGAWDGYFSYLAEKRGASRVLAVDAKSEAWKEDLLFYSEQNVWKKHTGKQGFDYAHQVLNSKVESRFAEMDEITKENLGEFDVVLCLGILYHMKEPWTIIKNLAQICKKQMIIETLTDGNYLCYPAMIFYPNAEQNNDAQTYWGPNVLCLCHMLKKEGFKEIEVKGIGGNRVALHCFK